MPKEPSEIMVDAETPSSQASLASQTWDKEDEYWACDVDGELESFKEDGDGDGDGDGHPTKQPRWAGT